MKYFRYTIITVFVCLMTYLIFAVIDNQMQTATVSRYTEEKSSQQMPPPPAKAIKNSEPIGGGPGDLPDKSSNPPPPVNKVKVLGIVELELSQANTWSSVFQILVIILGSALGIRIINTACKKFE